MSCGGDKIFSNTDEEVRFFNDAREYEDSETWDVEVSSGKGDASISENLLVSPKMNRRQALNFLAASFVGAVLGESVSEIYALIRSSNDLNIDDEVAESIWESISSQTKLRTLREGFSKNSKEYFFTRSLERAISGERNTNDLELCIKIAENQEREASTYILSALAGKIANIHGRTDYAFLTQYRSANLVMDGGILSQAGCIALSQLFPAGYTNMQKKELFQEDGIRQTWECFERVFDFLSTNYGVKYSLGDEILDFGKVVNKDTADIIAKSKMYRVMYDLRTTGEVRNIPAEKVGSYIKNLCLFRANINPRESLITMSPICIALIDSGNIKADLEVITFVLEYYEGHGQHKGMRDFGFYSRNTENLEYLIARCVFLDVLYALVGGGISMEDYQWKLKENLDIFKKHQNQLKGPEAFQAKFRREIAKAYCATGDDLGRQNMVAIEVGTRKISHRAFFPKTEFETFACIIST